MNWAIDALFNKEIVDSLDILVLASVSRTNDSTYTNCILVNQVDSLLWIDHESFSRAENILLFNVEVPVIGLC
jgi:hypothetical protein